MRHSIKLMIINSLHLLGKPYKYKLNNNSGKVKINFNINIMEY